MLTQNLTTLDEPTYRPITAIELRGRRYAMELRPETLMKRPRHALRRIDSHRMEQLTLAAALVAIVIGSFVAGFLIGGA